MTEQKTSYVDVVPYPYEGHWMVKDPAPFGIEWAIDHLLARENFMGYVWDTNDDSEALSHCCRLFRYKETGSLEVCLCNDDSAVLEVCKAVRFRRPDKE